MLAKELKSAAFRKGYSIEMLACSLGINQATLHRKLSGDTDFKLEEIKQLKKILALTDKEFKAIFFAE